MNSKIDGRRHWGSMLSDWMTESGQTGGRSLDRSVLITVLRRMARLGLVERAPREGCRHVTRGVNGIVPWKAVVLLIRRCRSGGARGVAITARAWQLLDWALGFRVSIGRWYYLPDRSPITLQGNGCPPDRISREGHTKVWTRVSPRRILVGNSAWVGVDDEPQAWLTESFLPHER
jgi:hypothetical protein